MELLGIYIEFVHFFGFVNIAIQLELACLDLFIDIFLYVKSYFSCSSYLPVQIRLRDYGVLDFDAGDTHRQPPVDTTWQQVIDKFLF